MSRPRLNSNNTLDKRNLQCVDSLLDPRFLGDEVVELFSDDGGGNEDFVDGGEALDLDCG